MASIVKLENVFQHVNGRCILDAINLTIEEGESFALVGPNGAGKTMLLRLIMGLDQPSAGRIIVFGKDYASLSFLQINQLRQKMGMVIQGGSLLNSLSVLENLIIPLRADGDNSVLIKRKARLIMTQLHLDGLENQQPGGLSGGMMRKVELARALIRKPLLLLWDELLDGLDPASIIEIQEHLQREKMIANMTLIFTTHQTAGALSMAERIAVLDHGRLIFIGKNDNLAEISEDDMNLRYALKGRL